jgi:hypothetical protein
MMATAESETTDGQENDDEQNRSDGGDPQGRQEGADRHAVGQAMTKVTPGQGDERDR